MRDLFSWSLQVARVFGVTIRVHILFFLAAAVLIAPVVFREHDPGIAPGKVYDVFILLALLLIFVLAHEVGHCLAARLMDGDATELTLWPLGGLAAVDVPHRPRSHLVTAAAGPAVNLAVCFVCALFLFFAKNHLQPPWNLFWSPYRAAPSADGSVLAVLQGYNGIPVSIARWDTALVARIFWVNWLLLVCNVMLPAFPLDGGRMLQCLLWPRLGFRQATSVAVYIGFFTMCCLGVYAVSYNDLLWLCLALFIYRTCTQQLILLETGGEDLVLGYDFSQGYTSLEASGAPTRTRRASTWQRWRQRRAARRAQREIEMREAEERRMDELLDKVQHHGLIALTEEERRFLKRVSDRYRNRQ
jgi:Zn-dependent protease